MLGLALLSVGNFYIANKTLGYFQVDAEAIPLLHTWSLAVEEQFYLLWPFLVVVLFKLVARRFIPVLMLLLVAFTSPPLMAAPPAPLEATDAMRGDAALSDVTFVDRQIGKLAYR